VSTPITWDEVTPALDIRAFTIKNVPDRMRRLPSDPLIPVLSETPDLVDALARLQSQLDE
jgi:DNA primase